MTREEYNREPVFYCNNCLGLHVKEVENIKDFHVCVDCGNTEIIEAEDIDEWNKLYVKEYGSSFMEE